MIKILRKIWLCVRSYWESEIRSTWNHFTVCIVVCYICRLLLCYLYRYCLTALDIQYTYVNLYLTDRFSISSGESVNTISDVECFLLFGVHSAQFYKLKSKCLHITLM